MEGSEKEFFPPRLLVRFSYSFAWILQDRDSLAQRDYEKEPLELRFGKIFFFARLWLNRS